MKERKKHLYRWFQTNIRTWRQVIKEDGTQQISLDVGTYIMTELAKLRDQYEIIGDVRGKGLMIGVEMVKDKVECVLFATSGTPHMLEQRAEQFGGPLWATVQRCPS